MNTPRWLLWGAIGAIVALIAGYAFGVITGDAALHMGGAMNLSDWLFWRQDEAWLWGLLGAAIGALVGAASRPSK